MISQLASLMLAIPMGLDKTLSALHDKLSPSIHAKAALDAQVAMLAEMNAPNRRSKAMEKTLGLQESIHDAAKSNASSSLSTSYNAYNILKQECVGCKVAEDALVSQLEVVISLHTTADEKLTEYNSAKADAEEASTKAASLEEERDQKCAGEAGNGGDEATTTTTTGTPDPCDTTPDCNCVKDGKLETQATEIGENAFNQCGALTSVVMPQVTKIAGRAFYDCGAFTSVVMPQVTKIGQSAFRKCGALTSVVMPEVTELGGAGSASAFFGCDALTSVQANDCGIDNMPPNKCQSP